MKNLKFIFTSLSFLALLSCGGNDKNFIEESGTIESREAVISSKVSGEIKSIFKDEGSQVAVGDTILIIDSETYTIQLKQQEAGRDIAKAQLNLLLIGARKEDIQQAQELLNQAEANYSIAKFDKDRIEELYKSSAVTKKQYVEISVRFSIAEAQLNSAKENFNKIKNIARPEEIEQARANYKKADAAVESVKKLIRDCYVVSPINGFIVKKFVELGETASIMTSLVKVSDLSKVEVDIYISETEIGKVKLGQKAEIKFDSFPDKLFEGKVIFISPEAEFTPKNIQTKDERTKLVFAVKVEIQNPNYELKAGLPTDVKIIF